MQANPFMLSEASMPIRLTCGNALCTPVIAYGLYLFHQTRAVRAWKTITARIVSFQKKWEASPPGVAQKALVIYSYELDGKYYQGTRLTIDDWLLAVGPIQVSKLAKAYRIGTVATAFYNPQQPERSILRRPGYLPSIAIILAGLISLAVLIVFIISGGHVPPGWHP
jgi:hypothetical protein